jgi:tetratricopeptide (TPR) repeat protein
MRLRLAGLVLGACLPVATAAMAEPDHPRMATTTTAAGERPADSPALRMLKQKIASAEAFYASEYMAGAFRGFEAVTRDPGFGQLSVREQRQVLSHAGFSAIRLDKPVQARDSYRRVTELGSDEPDDWYRLAALEYRLGAVDRARVAMRFLVEHWPELLQNIDSSVIPQLVYGTDPESDARFELMQALFDANWRDPVAADAIWYQFAIAQVERGKAGDAERTIRRIDEPDSIVRLRADKRFDSIVDPGADAFDPVLAARRKMERLSRAADAAPDKLDPIVQLSYSMLTLGMNEQVVALADKTIDEIADAPVGKPPFSDIDQQIWLMNNRSIAYDQMSKPQEALAELERARGFDEAGDANVSQALNLGVFHCRLSQPDKALMEIARLGELTAYGRMGETSVEHCAAMEVLPRKDADRALAYLRQHQADSPTLLLEALLREGRMDEAAELVEKQLADGYRRSDMLDWMQEWMPVEILPGEVAGRENRKALLARPDVEAALQAVGRIETVALYNVN